jgi:hypothetical protein
VLLVSLSASALAVVIAWLGHSWMAPGVDPSSRFWATSFFVALLWPIGLSLAGHILGVRVQLTAAACLLALTVAQQAGRAALPLPQAVRWSATLTQPGDAIRRQIVLPPPDVPAWQRAWQRGTRAVVAICTEQAVSAQAGVAVAVNDAAPVPLTAAPRTGTPEASGWYYLPVPRSVLEARRDLDVVLRYEGAGGAPAAFCGGRDDPARPGNSRSWRWRDGRWSADGLADLPILPVAGRVPPQRYYVEVRFLSADGLPHVAIW